METVSASPAPPSSPLEAVLRRDRAVTAAGLFGLVLLAWAYTVHLARAMGPMDQSMLMPQAHGWGPDQVSWLFVMWVVMMTAMMIPSAAPVILLFAHVARRRRLKGELTGSPTVFVLGYLLAWTGYSLLAALAQWGLHSHALLSPAMAGTAPVLGASLLLAAGIYQWLPFKQRCLVHCRSPLGFFAQEWREGTLGALAMGARHGSYCVGCCWLLMALLFVGGVMNLLWVAVIAIVVMLEKLAPAGPELGRLMSVLMVGWGLWLLLGPR
jgi:predicted metal-binding membrane protein